MRAFKCQNLRISITMLSLLIVSTEVGCQSTGLPRSLSFSSLMGRKKETTEASALAEVKKEEPKSLNKERLAQVEFRQGEQAFTAGDYEKARQHYEAAISHFADHKLAHHRLAYTYDQLKNPQLAEMHFLTAKQLAPGDADLLNDLGYFYMSQKRYADSERMLREALGINSRHQQAQLNMATLYARQGKADRALAMFRSVMPEEDAQASLKQALQQPSNLNPQPPIQLAAQTEDLDPFEDAPNDITRQLKKQMLQGREVSMKRRLEQQQELLNPLSEHPFTNSNELSDAMVQGAIENIETTPNVKPSWGNPRVPEQQHVGLQNQPPSLQQYNTAPVQTPANDFSAALPQSQQLAQSTSQQPLRPQHIATPQSATTQNLSPVSNQNPKTVTQPSDAFKAFELASEQAMLIGLHAGPGQLFPSLPEHSRPQTQQPVSTPSAQIAQWPAQQPDTHATNVSHQSDVNSNQSPPKSPQLPTIINGVPGQKQTAENPGSSTQPAWSEHMNSSPNNAMPVIAPRQTNLQPPQQTPPSSPQQNVPDWPYSTQSPPPSQQDFINLNRQQIENARQMLNSGQNWSLSPSTQQPAQTPLNAPTGNVSSAFEQQPQSESQPFMNSNSQTSGSQLPVIESR